MNEMQLEQTIFRLRAENAVMREALETIADQNLWIDARDCCDGSTVPGWNGEPEATQVATDALQAPPEESAVSWAFINRERGRLIDKQIKGVITESELVRLDALTQYADSWIDEVAARPEFPFEEIRRSISAVKSEGDICTIGPKHTVGNLARVIAAAEEACETLACIHRTVRGEDACDVETDTAQAAGELRRALDDYYQSL